MIVTLPAGSAALLARDGNLAGSSSAPGDILHVRSVVSKAVTGSSPRWSANSRAGDAESEQRGSHQMEGYSMLADAIRAG